MEVIISTRNPSKLVQIRALVAGSPLALLTLDDVGIEGSAVEDTSDTATLLGNASRKARFAYERSDKTRWVLADDTGLFIRALGGKPGVNAAVWGGEELATEDRTRHCLAQLDGVSDRRALFRTIVFTISPDGLEHVFDGAVEGKMRTAPRVPPQPKMPYSCLFVPNGEDRSWAEMTTEQENELSHRGIAFRKAVSFLSCRA